MTRKKIKGISRIPEIAEHFEIPENEILKKCEALGIECYGENYLTWEQIESLAKVYEINIEKIPINSIKDFIPKEGLSLVKYGGSEVTNKLGEDVIKSVITSILLGGNVRSLTEGLTKKRLMLSYASMAITFVKSFNNIDDFIEKIPLIVQKDLLENLTAEEKVYINWIVGLTGKGIQNIVRDDSAASEAYFRDLYTTVNDVVGQCKIDYGELVGTFKLGEMEFPVEWNSLLYLLTAIGAQTLTIRGSEKSIYGKLFEKMVLASLLKILGFRQINKDDTSQTDNVFWLSSTDEGEGLRESDATLLYRPGQAARFDIGFIGRGNPEISLDKVSRYRREIEVGGETYYSSTIILVDTIGSSSGIVDIAEELEGAIIQMSMTYWVKRVAMELHERLGFEHEFVSMSEPDSIRQIKLEMENISLLESDNT